MGELRIYQELLKKKKKRRVQEWEEGTDWAEQ